MANLSILLPGLEDNSYLKADVIRFLGQQAANFAR